MTTTSKILPTLNRRGFTYPLPPLGEAFVKFATLSSPVLDIGAAYGVATLPALQRGAIVIAVDLNQEHLACLRDQAGPYGESLRTIHARFPDSFLSSECHIDSSSIGGAYLSQVIPFLTPAEFIAGVELLYDWLLPNGKVFVVSFTPFLSHVHRYLPTYHQRKTRGERFCGYMTDLPRYCSDLSIGNQLPSCVLHVDEDDLRITFQNAGFTINELGYFGERDDELPSGIRYDGRERIAMIATKPV